MARLKYVQHDGYVARTVLVGSAHLPGGGGMFYAIDVSERKRIQGRWHWQRSLIASYSSMQRFRWEEDMSVMVYVDTLRVRHHRYHGAPAG